MSDGTPITSSNVDRYLKGRTIESVDMRPEVAPDGTRTWVVQFVRLDNGDRLALAPGSTLRRYSARRKKPIPNGPEKNKRWRRVLKERWGETEWVLLLEDAPVGTLRCDTQVGVAESGVRAVFVSKWSFKTKCGQVHALDASSTRSAKRAAEDIAERLA